MRMVNGHGGKESRPLKMQEIKRKEEMQSQRLRNMSHPWTPIYINPPSINHAHVQLSKTGFCHSTVMLKNMKSCDV